MRPLRALSILLGLQLGCAATIPRAEHEARLASEQRESERRLRDLHLERVAIERAVGEVARDAEREGAAVAARTLLAERALVRLERILHEPEAGAAPGPPAGMSGFALGERRGGRASLDLLLRPGAAALDSTGLLDAWLAWMRDRPRQALLVRIHTDTARTDDGFGLSPAALIAEALAAKRPPFPWVVETLGEFAPLTVEDTPEARATNRRVEVLAVPAR